jgi:hypothetical protein
MAESIDYMHLVKVGKEWKIIHILWELTPEKWVASGGARGERTQNRPCVSPIGLGRAGVWGLWSS